MKKRKLWKRFTASLLTMSLLFGSSGMQSMQVKAAQECYEIETSNESEQNYQIWADTINSYLSYDGKYIMRVEAPESSSDDQRILVEYYDSNYKFVNQKALAEELPIFGAFHESENHYYILTGQENPNQDDKLEVFRITKYDKNWNRITSVGLYGANTLVPFDAGSARIADDGEYLLVRTSHQMYNGHQANVTIQIKIDTMEITDSFTGVMDIDWGYVSHSFNQFIQIDDGKMVALDHGDCYPRSLVLVKYLSEVSSGKFKNGWDTCVHTDFLRFQSSGDYNMNLTGASVGAFEVTDSTYLTAGNYVGEEKEVADSTRNIFVASVSKDLSETKFNWITDYTEGTVSTPHMVSIGNSEYMLLWSKEDNVYYTKIDTNGNQIGEIYSMSAVLSDCVPIVVSGKVVWYVTSEDSFCTPIENSEESAWYMTTEDIITFYQIDCSDLSNTNISMEINGHTYEHTENSNGYANFTCARCSGTMQEELGESVWTLWSDDWTRVYRSLEINEQLDYSYGVIGSTNNVNEDYIVEISNPDIVDIYAYGGTGSFIAKKEGITNVTFIPKYNESLAKTYTICVGNTQCVLDLNFKTQYVCLKLGETKQLDAVAGPENATDKTILYTSLDPSIATVSSDGVVTGKNIGKTQIAAVAKYGNGNYVETTCTIEVTSTGATAELTINEKNKRINQGEALALTTTLVSDYEEDKNLTWESLDPDIVEVNDKGEVIGKNPGQGIIRVTSGYSNLTDFCNIIVRYKINYELNGGENNKWNPVGYYDQRIELENPTREGYTFDGWYTEASFKNKVTVIEREETGNKTFYAKWTKVITDDDNNETPVTNPFTDVSESMYYYAPVLWAYEKGITAGISITEFAPEQICTRGQVVTFLWRAMGQPEPDATINPFVDVNSDEYYYKAVLWALENGITAGTDATHFAPDATVTRGQFVTFLHRAESKPSYNVSNPFADVSNSIYYYDAVLWAYQNGVTAGTDSIHFAPEDACTRGQVVTFLYRALAE